MNDKKSGLVDLLSSIWRHPLNRFARTKAILRFIRWQVSSRVIREKIALPFVNDTVLLVGNGMTGATGNYYYGLHEPDDMGFVLHVLQPGELFVDIGANVGSYTILAASIGATVLSVEPIPATLEHLKQNVAINGFSRSVTPRRNGISNVTGVLHFSTDRDTMNRVVAEGEDVPSSVEVEVITLDSLCEGRSPTIIKIDVEGHEQAVLLGGAATLESPALIAVILEINGNNDRCGVSESALVLLMREHGFSPIGYNAITRQFQEATAGKGNTIFIRDRDGIASRIGNAGRSTLINGTI